MAAREARPNNLPFQVTRLLGRERELRGVRTLLFRDPSASSGQARLVTLTGPGGSGKTRLGLQAATELLDHFEDGAFFVDLAPISDPGLVVSSIARALGLRDAAGRPLQDVLVDFLRGRWLLLLLDNFEQILPAATMVAHLLSTCPRLSVLVTSRAPLQIGGEHELPVPPLSLPRPTEQPTPDRLVESAAVALFVERATAIRSDFVLTDANAPAVAEICIRLDGLPLAIELAAARIRLLSPEAMLVRLGDRFELLTGDRRDVPARQQTLRNTIAWSYDLLSETEQTLLRRLGVFVGGFTLGAGDWVLGTGDRWSSGRSPSTQHPAPSTLDVVGSLVARSLLRAEGADDEPRFSMLETIREYALGRLAESGELNMLRRRHAEYFLMLAEQAEPHILSVDGGHWLNRLQADHDNLRAALFWSLGDDGDVEIGVRIAAALSRFWQLRSYLSEGQRWLDLALASSNEEPASSRAKALTGAGWLVHNSGDPRRAAALFAEAADLARQSGDRYSLALAAGDLGVIMEQQGEYERATALMTESLNLYREIGNREGVADRLRGLGSAACAQGDFPRAVKHLEENLAECRQFGGAFRLALALGALGLAVLYQGDAERALNLFDESLAHFREIEHTYGIAWAQHYLGRVELLRGDIGRGAALLVESLDTRQRLGDRSGIAQCLETIGAVGLARRQATQAVSLFAAAASLREAIDSPLAPAERVGFDRELAAARAQIGEEAFAAVWAEGWVLPIDLAVERALELSRSEAGAEPAQAPRAKAVRASSLTPRECEVAVLIARGLSNRQIATELIISERTADTHVRNILGKLDLTSRAQVATWATRRGLAETG